MSGVIEWWGDLPPPMKEAIEQFRTQLGAAIDAVEFVKRALDRQVPEIDRGQRLCLMFAAVHESGYGTKQTCRSVNRMSAFGGEFNESTRQCVADIARALERRNKSGVYRVLLAMEGLLQRHAGGLW